MSSRMNTRIGVLIALLLGMIVIAGCTKLPAPAASESPLASPQPQATVERQTEPAAIPTPGGRYGVVTGVVVLETTRKPPTEAIMYLGVFSKVENTLPVVEVNRDVAPRAVPSLATGRFVFADVPPGQYALSYWTPDGSALVNDPNDPEHSLILTVEPGKTIDIGTLRAPVF